MSRISSDEAYRIYLYLKDSGHLAEIEERRGFHNPPEWGFEVGQRILMRCVPMYFEGEVIEWSDKVIVLGKAAKWVADTKDFETALKNKGSGMRTATYVNYVRVNLNGMGDWTPMENIKSEG